MWVLGKEEHQKFKAKIDKQSEEIISKVDVVLVLNLDKEKNGKVYKKYIENSFKYDINNGINEGINNYIKCIKRIAFGYRRFDHIKARILLNKGIIKG